MILAKQTFDRAVPRISNDVPDHITQVNSNDFNEKVVAILTALDAIHARYMGPLTKVRIATAQMISSFKD